MLHSVRLLAPSALFAAALAAAPAMAQINVGLGGQAGGGIGVGVGGQAGAGVGVGGSVNPTGTIGTVTGTIDRSVTSVDRTVNRTLDRDLRVATSADVTAGAMIRDREGRRIGTVQSLHGSTAVVVEGNRTLHVPIAALYRSGKGLVTRLSRAELRANARADANAGATARN
jgi:hypothetical protein